jgi:hypothetical protein
MKVLLPLLLLVGLCAGCSTHVTIRKSPTLDLGRFHRIFVIQPLNENHHLDEMFVAELQRGGREAKSGPVTMMPEETDAVLMYEAQWTGDFITSLLDLNVEMHTAHTNKRLVEAQYYQPSARPKRPEKVVHDLVQQLFPK